MKITLLLGQRECSYEGQYAPEVLEAADEYTMDENPEWIRKKFEEYRKSKEFTSLAYLNIKVPNSAIDQVLNPKVIVEAEVLPEN